MTPLDLVITAIVAGVGAYFGSYLKKKGENLATHEDIDKLVVQVSAVTTTTKEIEATISNVTWKRERKYEWQLKAIESFNALTSEYISNVVPDSNYTPTLEWFAAFDANGALIKALFDDEVYAIYEKFERRIGTGLDPTEGKTTAQMRLFETRNVAVKAMLNSVIGQPN